MQRPDPTIPSAWPARPSRRRFVEGLTLAGLAAACGWPRTPSAQPRAGGVPELRGDTFDLDIGALPVNFTGAPRLATVVNGSLPAPTLRWKEGDDITLRVRNRLPTASSLHWHGLLVPAGMDGVPGLSFAGIAPGGSYTYRFRVEQAGTYWYHSHTRFQEQTGLYGAIVIEPRAGERFPADRDYAVVLSDWSDEDPERIYANLKKRSDYYNYGKSTAGDFLRDARAQGLSAALAERRMGNRMRMDRNDLSDVSGATYTYLMNGAPPAANWTALFARGEAVKLRIINSASMTLFDVRIPGLKMRVVAADGQDVAPVNVDEFRIAPGETCDVVVRPEGDGAYAIFAQAMDRSGYACGTLASHAGLRAPTPAPDPRPVLAMADMMGDMHGKRVPGTPPAGPSIDMTVPTPRTNLDDPGVGLRDNGRDVLSYADLHTLGGPLSAGADREIVLHLTGHMQRYLWSFDGRRFSDAEPLRFRHGERVRITLVNDTMMTHPIHLHGMWSELETPRGAFLARKHTVVVQPAQKLSYRIDAGTPGRWAYHCHLLYHMEAGMFREVAVA